MSLINQVLQNVAHRQGMSPAAETPWAAQVKPVLHRVEQDAHRWSIKPWMLLLTGLALAGYFAQNSVVSMWHSSQQVWRKQVETDNMTPVSTSVPKPVQTQQQWNGQPQLAKTLSTDWQSMTMIKKSETSAKTAATVTTSAETAVVPPAKLPVPVVTGTPLAAAAVPSNTEKPAPADAMKADVIKQIKPDQEANVLIQRAIDHEQKGRTSEAVATLRQTLAQFPQAEDARLLLANHLFESKQDNEAVALLQSGIASHPEQSGVRKALARWQLSHAQPEAVVSTLKPISNVSAQDAEWQWMMAMAYQQSEQHALAVTYFDQALKLQPTQAQWLVASAMSLQALGQHAAALRQLQLAQNLPMSERMAEFVSQRIQLLVNTAHP